MGNAGKRVKVHYVGTLDDGTQFDSSIERGEPIEFVCQTGQMIKGFDAAVEDMVVGETRQVHIPASEAYGQPNPNLVQSIPIDQIPGLDEVPVGDTVYLRGPDAVPMEARVVEVTDTTISLDLNHRLAGRSLNFEITVLEIAD